MTRCNYHRAIALSSKFLATAITAAQEPVIHTDSRTTSSTFRDRGTSYAPTYLTTLTSSGAVTTRNI